MGRRVTIGAVAAWFLALGVLAAPVAMASCSGGSTVVTDRKGDATGFIEPDLGLPNQPSLDLTKGYITYSPSKSSLTFSTLVANLTDAPPDGAMGKFFRFIFTYERTQYQVSALSNDVTGDKVFRLGVEGDATFTSILDLKGKLYTKTNRIAVALPLSSFNKAVKTHFTEAGQRVPAKMGAGSTLGSFQLLGQRLYDVVAVAFTPTADSATGKCLYVIGSGSSS